MTNVAENIVNKEITELTHLCTAIVEQAVIDWRKLLKKHNYNGASFYELRKFFKSEWCELLLTTTDINPLKILDLLEDELDRAGGEYKLRQANKRAL